MEKKLFYTYSHSASDRSYENETIEQVLCTLTWVNGRRHRRTSRKIAKKETKK